MNDALRDALEACRPYIESHVTENGTVRALLTKIDAALASSGWRSDMEKRIDELVEIINAGDRLASRINGNFVLDRDRVKSFLFPTPPTTPDPKP